MAAWQGGKSYIAEAAPKIGMDIRNLPLKAGVFGVEPRSPARSEGRAVRVIDERAKWQRIP